MRESLFVTFVRVPFRWCLRGITLSHKVIEPFFFGRKERLHGYCFGEMLLHQFLIFLVAELIQDRAHVWLGYSSRWKKPAWGTRPCWNYHATWFKLSKVNVIHNKSVNTGLSRVLFRHEDFIQHQLVYFLSCYWALHWKIDTLSVEILKVLFFKLIKYVLNLFLFFVIVYLLIA